MPQSLGALGGKPNNAYYFIGFLGKKRGFTSKSSRAGLGVGRKFAREPRQFWLGDPHLTQSFHGLWSAHPVSGLICGE